MAEMIKRLPGFLVPKLVREIARASPAKRRWIYIFILDQAKVSMIEPLPGSADEGVGTSAAESSS